MKPIILTLLASFLLSMVACTTYEEGPDFSVFPVNYRVTNTWEWGYSLRNEENLTGEYADSTIQFRDDGVVRICDTLDNCREGSWNLVRKRTRLQMIFGEQAVAYEIRMLRRDELWLSYQDPEDTLLVEWELVPAR
ncbi:MAG: hypothetical protein AAF399_01250 [Bacteroidota bacterium]